MLNQKVIFKIVIAAVVLVALWFGYRLFFPKPAAETEPPGLVAAGYLSGAGGQQEVTDEFLRILNSLQGVELKGDLFSTDFFQSLNDIPIILPEITPGRPNPFAPLGFGAVRASSTSPAPAARRQATAPPPAPSGNDAAREALCRSLGITC
ncbi:MAG: hypothetical protein HYT48_00535 [Candidatus Vogelbacteria bacterium]|nr:hypothetical protein [Candidatus Vogelbacteria bacterium]